MTERIQVQTEHLRKMSRSVKGLSALLTNIDSELSHRISVLPLVGHTRMEVDTLWGVEHKRIQHIREHVSRITALLDKTARDFDAADGRAAVMNSGALAGTSKKGLEVSARNDARDKLANDLIKIWSDNLTLKERALLIEWPSHAFAAVVMNDERITHVSEELGVPKAMIQAIIYREQSIIGVDDIVSDSLVRMDARADSSTGLGQIFAKTAIDAERPPNKEVPNPQEPIKPDVMWEKLQSPDTNIHYIGKVLKMEAQQKGIDLMAASNEQVHTVFSKYNGSGNQARRYGEITVQYYDLFNRYNEKWGSI